MTKAGWSLALGSQILLALGCHPNTTRPTFPPLPGAPFAELNLTVPRATGIVADAMRQDSLPVSIVEPRDGLIETPWFDATSGRPIGQRRAIGPGVVRIRAWADPARPGSSQLTVETLYRPRVDPSLPYRELERQVSRDHPVAKKVEAALLKMVQRFGGPPPPQAQQPPANPDQSD